MKPLTLSDLHTRQAWPLNQKIDHTVGAIEAFVNYCKEHGRAPYASFSGGLNSTVLLDLARRYVDPDMPGVFCSTGNEYPEIVRFVRHTDNVTIIRPKMTPREVIAKYGFPLVSKEQAQSIYEVRHVKGEKTLRRRLEGGSNRSATISKKWRYLITEPYEVSHKCCEQLKKGPMRRFYRKNKAVAMMGTMACESQLRIGQYLTRGGCNSFSDDPLKVHSAPLSIWTNTDCWDYIHRFDVPYCSIYDVPGIDRTGCVFCGFGAHLGEGSRFRVLYSLHPKLYQMAMNYTSNGYTLRYALRRMGVQLPDEQPELF
jgi:PP-loop domain protein|nr:MAG TPA: phosphoadenosine-phosphosulfate reductase [Caudoviricetes sp.]